MTNSMNTLFFCLLLSLTGCIGVYEGGFECPPGRGVGCKSISEVNQFVEQGQLPPGLSQRLSQPCDCGSEDLRHSAPTPEIWYAPWVVESTLSNPMVLEDLYPKDFENSGRRTSGEPDECSDLHDRGRVPKCNDPETDKAKGI